MLGFMLGIMLTSHGHSAIPHPPKPRPKPHTEIVCSVRPLLSDYQAQVRTCETVTVLP